MNNRNNAKRIVTDVVELNQIKRARAHENLESILRQYRDNFFSKLKESYQVAKESDRLPEYGMDNQAVAKVDPDQYLKRNNHVTSIFPQHNKL